MLSQLQANGVENVIAFATRALSARGKNYYTTFNEMLTIIYALCHFQPCSLEGSVLVRTVHKSLLWGQSFPGTEGQIVCWQEVPQDYQFVCKHRARVKHENADALFFVRYVLRFGDVIINIRISRLGRYSIVRCQLARGLRPPSLADFHLHRWIQLLLKVHLDTVATVTAREWCSIPPEWPELPSAYSVFSGCCGHRLVSLSGLVGSPWPK